MKILAVGMNYAQHNKELDGTLVIPKEPVIFTKPETALLKDGKPFFLPEDFGRVDYETELVVRISRLGKNIAQRFAYRYYDAVTLGIDLTARDMQNRLRSEGKPWDICKGFDGAAPIGKMIPMTDIADVQNVGFHLDIDGHTVQSGCTADMLFKVDELIAYISKFITLKMGDLIFTGTPVGVGPISIGQHLEGYIEDQKVLEFNVK